MSTDRFARSAPDSRVARVALLQVASEDRQARVDGAVAAIFPVARSSPGHAGKAAMVPPPAAERGNGLLA